MYGTRATLTRIVPWSLYRSPGSLSTKAKAWGAFGGLLSAPCYDSNPTVSHVKLTGVNAPSQETSLPGTVNEIINNGQCTGYDDVQNWINLGYTRTLVEGAWQQFAADFSTAFPHKEFAEGFKVWPATDRMRMAP